MGVAAKKAVDQKLKLVIDLDERGRFLAHVENEKGKTVFEFSNEDHDGGCDSDAEIWLVANGYMKHGRDVIGLLDYLQNAGIVSHNANLVLAH